ncbi:uncharacterized protein PpBr36_11177 [Pyricularia pennisetigena]|uniref:uncharacterized protein n=1 Tax=Pyricularia pennisetigena TaxID=1578925 RepID=UPI001152A709|nr:uncharacterized protein PpBr36_11177 [Pyricularia pennisetigena]TLS20493.1 hypothetical protein PpBr36_11177 [Pyricularia pennisetigena]
MAPLVSANLRMSFDSKRPDDPGSTTSKVAMSQRRPRFFRKDVMILPLNLDPGPETNMKPVLKLELQVASLEDDCALSMFYQFETRFVSGLHGREISQECSLFLLRLLWVQPEAAWMAGSPQTICVWKASLQSSMFIPQFADT